MNSCRYVTVFQRFPFAFGSTDILSFKFWWRHAKSHSLSLTVIRRSCQSEKFKWPISLVTYSDVLCLEIVNAQVMTIKISLIYLYPSYTVLRLQCNMVYHWYGLAVPLSNMARNIESIGVLLTMYDISCTFIQHGQKYRINRSVTHSVLY